MVFHFADEKIKKYARQIGTIHSLCLKRKTLKRRRNKKDESTKRKGKEEYEKYADEARSRSRSRSPLSFAKYEMRGWSRTLAVLFL